MLDLLQETLRYIQEQNELLTNFKSIITEKEEKYKVLHSKICYQILEEMQKQEIVDDADQNGIQNADLEDEEEPNDIEENTFLNEQSVFRTALNNLALCEAELTLIENNKSRNVFAMKEEINQDQMEEQNCLNFQFSDNYASTNNFVDNMDSEPVNEDMNEIKEPVVNDDTCITDEVGISTEAVEEASTSNATEKLDIKEENPIDLSNNFQVVAYTAQDDLSSHSTALENICLIPAACASTSSSNDPAGPSVKFNSKSTASKQNHKCKHCKKVFNQKKALEAHSCTNTGEKPHKCAFCKMSFKRKTNLVTHTRLHTGEKPYMCEFCNMPFRQLSHLINHRRRHTGEKPFQCTICGKAYGQKSSLLYHFKHCNLSS